MNIKEIKAERDHYSDRCNELQRHLAEATKAAARQIEKQRLRIEDLQHRLENAEAAPQAPTLLDQFAMSCASGLFADPNFAERYTYELDQVEVIYRYASRMMKVRLDYDHGSGEKLVK